MFSFKNVTFPVVVLQFRTKDEDHFKLEFDHSYAQKRYELPSQIAARSDYLIPNEST